MTRQLKLARQQERRKKRQEAAVVLPKCLRVVLLLLYVFGGYRPDFAQSYWNLQRSRKKLRALAQEESKCRIENIFLECDLEELDRLSDPNRARSTTALRRASYWFNKMKLAEWVRMCNLQQGLAPCSRLVVCKWNALRRSTPFLWKIDDHLDPSVNAGSRVLLWRWRRAVRGRWKPIRVLEYVPLEVKRNKALLANRRSRQNYVTTSPALPERSPKTNLGTVSVPKKMSIFRLFFRTPERDFSSSRPPFRILSMALVLGPHCLGFFVLSY